MADSESDSGRNVALILLAAVAAGDPVRVRWIGDSSEAVLFRTAG